MSNDNTIHKITVSRKADKKPLIYSNNKMKWHNKLNVII